MWIVNIAQRRKVRQIHWIDYNKEKRFLNGILAVTLNSRVAFYMRFSVMCGILLMFIAYLKRKYLCITNMFLMPKSQTSVSFYDVSIRWIFNEFLI